MQTMKWLIWITCVNLLSISDYFGTWMYYEKWTAGQNTEHIHSYESEKKIFVLPDSSLKFTWMTLTPLCICGAHVLVSSKKKRNEINVCESDQIDKPGCMRLLVERCFELTYSHWRGFYCWLELLTSVTHSGLTSAESSSITVPALVSDRHSCKAELQLN